MIQSLNTFGLKATSLKQVAGDVFEGQSKAFDGSVVFLKIPAYLGDVKKIDNKFQGIRTSRQGRMVFKEFGTKRAASQWLETEFKKEYRELF